jgi:hypothetical protein
MKIDPELQAQVDAQLIEQGAYATLELLINTGRLLYADYERWRRGEIELLDDVLMGSPKKIRAQTEDAAAYARSIGLVEQPQEFHRWGAQDSKPLRTSADQQFARLIAARFAPAQATPQLDLFFDNPVVALTNGIAQALATHNLGEAQRQLDRLYAQAPNHADLAAYDRLTSALESLDRPIVSPEEALAFLLDITPTAKRLLGGRFRDLLTPMWRRLAEAMNDQPYSSATPNLHRSFALAQAQDWSGVIDCIRAEPDWHLHAPLCLRLAQAGFYRQQRVDALTAWFHLCWLHPDEATRALDSKEHKDASVAAAWAKFEDGDDSLFDDAPDVGDFPAWMLLREPGLALQLPVDLPTGTTPGEVRYGQVHRWIHARRAAHQDEELALRKAIKDSSPFLFHTLKRVVSA